MSAKKKPTSVADVHTPEELLETAEYYFSLKSPKANRVAVFEAIVALESFVQRVVFSSLQTTMDPLLVKWLEDKTKMDFDSRLSVLTPVATGLPVDKQAGLWNAYRKAKEIRNKVSHSGHPVSDQEAGFVIDTVCSWLAYLGSTVELEVALLEMRAHIREQRLAIHSQTDAQKAVADYFVSTRAAKAYMETSPELEKIPRRADFILKFGPYLVLFETKFLSEPSSFRRLLSAVEQAHVLVDERSNIRGVVVLVQSGRLEPGVPVIQRHHGGTILSVVVDLVV